MPAASVASPTREAILDAADRLLGRFGFRKMTLDDLAREAGVGRRTLYLWFASKEEIALSSIDRVVERLCARLADIAASDLAPEDKLRAMLIERVRFRVESVRDYYESLDELFAVLRTAYMQRRDGYFAREAELFAGVVAEGRRSGALDCEDPQAAARALLIATNALLPYSLTPRELGARSQILRDVERIADLVLQGLRSRDGRTRRDRKSN